MVERQGMLRSSLGGNVASNARRRRRLAMAIGLMALLSAAASVAFAASHSQHPRTRALEVACAKKGTGLLRYVSSAARCDRGSERAVDFAKDAPVYACIRPDAANGIA